MILLKFHTLLPATRCAGLSGRIILLKVWKTPGSTCSTKAVNTATINGRAEVYSDQGLNTTDG